MNRTTEAVVQLGDPFKFDTIIARSSLAHDWRSNTKVQRSNYTNSFRGSWAPSAPARSPWCRRTRALPAGEKRSKIGLQTINTKLRTTKIKDQVYLCVSSVRVHRRHRPIVRVHQHERWLKIDNQRTTVIPKFMATVINKTRKETSQYPMTLAKSMESPFFSSKFSVSELTLGGFLKWGSAHHTDSTRLPYHYRTPAIRWHRWHCPGRRSACETAARIQGGATVIH